MDLVIASRMGGIGFQVASHFEMDGSRPAVLADDGVHELADFTQGLPRGGW